MSDFTEGSLHYFPLRDVPQAKDISHPHGRKLVIKLVPNIDGDFGGFSCTICLSWSQCIGEKGEVIIVRLC